MLNILLPIILNIVLVSVVIAELFVSRKQGWRLALTKLILTLGAGVGSWFLAPTLATELSKIEFIANLHLVGFNYVVFALSTLVEFILISIVCAIISRSRKFEKQEGFNTAKVKRAKSTDRRLERRLRKEERRARKLDRKLRKLGKGSKVAGAVLGVMTGILLSGLVYIPVRAGLTYLKEITTQEYFESAYKYTAFGQLEEIVIDFVKGE